MPFAGMATFNSTQEQALETIKKKYNTKADAYLEAVRKAYPDDTKPSDLLDIDFTFRPGAVLQFKQIKIGFEWWYSYLLYLFSWQ